MSIGGLLIFLGEFPENREQLPTGDVLTVIKERVASAKVLGAKPGPFAPDLYPAITS
jgi:hypothetical protein